MTFLEILPRLCIFAPWATRNSISAIRSKFSIQRGALETLAQVVESRCAVVWVEPIDCRLFRLSVLRNEVK